MARDFILEEVATTEDLRRLEELLTTRIDALDQRFNERLTNTAKSLEQRMTIKLSGMLVVAVGSRLALERLVA